MSWEGIACLFLGILLGTLGMATYLAILIKKFRNETKCDQTCEADWWKNNQEPPF